MLFRRSNYINHDNHIFITILGLKIDKFNQNNKFFEKTYQNKQMYDFLSFLSFLKI